MVLCRSDYRKQSSKSQINNLLLSGSFTSIINEHTGCFEGDEIYISMRVCNVNVPSTRDMFMDVSGNIPLEDQVD